MKVVGGPRLDAAPIVNRHDAPPAGIVARWREGIPDGFMETRHVFQRSPAYPIHRRGITRGAARARSLTAPRRAAKNCTGPLWFRHDSLPLGPVAFPGVT